ncbi:MAG: PD-(D/E)XK nuclease family protein [Patescibacteria group bacterium]|nr:PD-(D/E)XK nuclease family protein [Patescibacteria group bacterium]
MADFDHIVEAILAEGVSPPAAEIAGTLVEDWLRHYADKETDLRTVGVSVKLACEVARLGDGTPIWAVGIADHIYESASGDIVLDEWKTTQSRSSRWNEKAWWDSLVESPQLAFYNKLVSVAYPSRNVRLRPRAIVRRGAEIEFWPDHEVFAPAPASTIDLTTVLLHESASLLLSARADYAPWQLMGPQCHAFFRECEHLAGCKAGEFPSRIVDKFRGSAYREESWAVPANAIVWSPTSYAMWTSCKERWRRNYLVGAERETTLDLEIGRAFHAGLSAWYEKRKLTT